MTKTAPVTPAPSMRCALAATLALLAGLSSLACGYRLVGKGSSLPAHVKVIGVPPFGNQTTRPELGQRITENVVEALVGRGQYRVVSDDRGVDAVLRGRVTSWDQKSLQLGEGDGATERVSVTLRASVTFEDRVQRRVTWHQDDYSFTAEYDVIGDPDEYFDTELEAVEEVADDFARAVVSAILQGF